MAEDTEGIDPRARIQLATDCDRQGRLTEAYAHALAVLESGGLRAEALAALARIGRHSALPARNRAAVDHATELCELALAEEWPTERLAWATLELAAAYATLQHHARVLDLVAPFLRDPPMGWVPGRAWFLLGTVRDQQADYPAALAAYQRALAAYGTETRAPLGAEELATEVARARGAAAGVLDRLGQSLIAREMYAEAGAHWSGAGATDARGRAIWLLNQAIVARHLGEYVRAAADSKAAATAFAAMQEMEHAEASALANLANVRIRLGQPAEARQAAESAVRRLAAGVPGPEQPPRLADIRVVLGNCLADAGDEEQARREYQAALATPQASTLDRARYRVLLELVRAQIGIPDMNAYAAAVAELEQHRTGLQHDEALARANSAFLIEQSGDVRRAERDYRLALERLAALEGTERTAARCRVDLAYALAKQGRLREALEHAAEAALFLDADRFTIKTRAAREQWFAGVVRPAFVLAMRLAAACGDDERLSDLIILSRASGVRLARARGDEVDAQDSDLPLGPLPTLLHPSDDRPLNDVPGSTARYFC